MGSLRAQSTPSLHGVLFASAVALLILAPERGRACDCSPDKAFLEVAPGAELVVLGKVVRHMRVANGELEAFEFQVKKMLLGKTKRDKLRIIGSPGHLCIYNASKFKDGTRWVLVLRRFQLSYVVSFCGEYALEVKDGVVQGHILEDSHPKSRQRMFVEDLERRLKAAVDANRHQFPRKVKVK